MSEATVNTKINEASPRKVQKWLFKRLPETRAGGQRERVESMGEALPEPDLLCPFCSLLKDGAVIAKCCFATACKICAEEAAAKGDPCVACGGRVVGADLRADPDTRRRVDRYRRANPVRGTQSRSNLGRLSFLTIAKSQNIEMRNLQSTQRSVDFWGRKCVETALFYCAYRAVYPSTSVAFHAIPDPEIYTTE